MINKVLIVDDSVVARKMISGCLPKDRDFTLHEATDGAIGFEVFKQIKPDLTFLDLTMPVLDGIGCLKKIREIQKDAYVIVVTADIQEKSQEEVKNLDAYCLVQKPPDKQKILDLFNEVDKLV